MTPPARQAVIEEDSGTFRLGVLTGQVKELIHRQNNDAQVLQGVSETVAALKEVPADIKAIRLDITALQAGEHQRAGAFGIVRILLSSPTIPWLILVAGGVMAYVKGLI